MTLGFIQDIVIDFIVFFHYHIVPLYPLPPPAISKLLSMSMSPFHFCSIPPPSNPSAIFLNSLTLVFEERAMHLLVLLVMNWLACKGICMTLDLVRDTLSLVHLHAMFPVEFELHQIEAKYLTATPLPVQ